MADLIREVQNEELGLVLRKYTKRVFYKKLWNADTENARGHVTDLNGNPIASPFNKFFNLDENVKTSREAAIVELDERGYQMYRDTKWNGHLSIMYKHKGLLLNHTSGTFDHPFNKDDRRIIEATGFNEINVPESWTLMFEIIGNHDKHVMTDRHIAELGGERAILLGVHSADGRPIHRNEYMAHFIKHGVTELSTFGKRVRVADEMRDMGVTASEYLDFLLNQSFVEGSILYNPVTQWRVKLKTKWFIKARYLKQFSHERVQTLWLKHYDSGAAYDKIPEELHAEYKDICDGFEIYRNYYGNDPVGFANMTNFALVEQ